MASDSATQRDLQTQAHSPDNSDQASSDWALVNPPNSPVNRQYHLHDPHGIHTHYYNLPKRPVLFLPTIPMLRGQDDNNFDAWLYYVHAALDTWDLAPFINHHLPHPEKPKTDLYREWRKTALYVSGWLRLHISEEVLMELSLVCQLNQYPDELMFTLARSLSATGIDCLPGNQAPGLPKRDNFHMRSEYIRAMCAFFTKDTSMPVTNYRVIMTMLDGLEQEIPYIAAGQRQSLREHPLITKDRFRLIVDRLIDAEY